jgi:hypothetical protein
LVRAYRESYAVARHNPGRYAAMSRAARAALRDFCSVDVAARGLAGLLAFSPGGVTAGGDDRAERIFMIED